MRCPVLKSVTVWLLMFLFKGSSVYAQTVDSDHTTGTIVHSRNGSFVVTEGTARFGNASETLFHSFNTFSPYDSSVTFDLRDNQNILDTQAVTAIVGRVTGGTSSFINGPLSILHDSGTPRPDLFLINPQGFLFGENARLSLPGSLLVSTAQSISFDQKTTFSATSLDAAPLLTVNVPTGLQFGGSHSAGITLQDTGHALSTTNPIFAPYFLTENRPGLSVSAGESLHLIGSSINVSGGILRAPGGRIELGSILEGTVTFTEQGTTYSAVSQFGNIELKERSLIDISGVEAGSAHLQGQQIHLSEGSLVWSQNQGSNAAGAVTASAAEKLSLTGVTPAVDATSGIVTETLGPGDASAIDINAVQLSVESGAVLGSRSFGAGDSGHLTIATEQADISGYVPIAPNVFSSVGTLSFINGNSGDTKVTSHNLSITAGGYLGSTTLGSGQGGDVTVNADFIQVDGATPTAIPSIISATTAGRLGNSGDLQLKTRQLIIQDSGLVTTSSIGVGDAGDISVDATERITLVGGLPNLPTSTIASTVDFPPLSYKLLLDLSGTPHGSAGNVTVSAPVIEIHDQTSITVANLAGGDAGQLTINARFLDIRQGKVDAFTMTGNGGNIDLNIKDILLMRNESVINATANNNGNGGNLRIDSPFIVGVENSDIVANATTGNGGNIDITTKGIFGLVARDQQTPESDITASSEFGLNGFVAVEGFTVVLDSVLVELPAEVADASNQIASGCASSDGNRFVVSGRGGLPPSPNEPSRDRSWSDTRDLSAFRNLSSQQSLDSADQRVHSVTEAATWTIDEQGRVSLIAETGVAPIIHPETCSSQVGSTYRASFEE